MRLFGVGLYTFCTGFLDVMGDRSESSAKGTPQTLLHADGYEIRPNFGRVHPGFSAVITREMVVSAQATFRPHLIEKI